jgi:multisubunit Na+/H+ antiporter MnhG subunit
MVEWLSEIWASWSLQQLLFGILLFLVSLAVSFAAIAIVMVRVPPTYFSVHHRREFLPDRVWYVRYSAVIAKNVLGVFLVLLGIVLSLPGVPGQGILTILLGLIMLDIPGKRPLEAKIIQRPTVLAAVNKLRSRYGRPPLIMD